MNFQARLQAALARTRSTLLEARDAHGHWTGELSSSALSTATAVCALAMVQRHGKAAGVEAAAKIARGLDWLAANVNADGGWGDTTLSLSNISTTTLCWAVFGMAPSVEDKYRSVVQGAERWLQQHAGSIAPGPLSAAIIQRYGNDRTFSVPILTMCALAGRLGQGRDAWAQVIQLPFELAVCPPEWFAALRLPVVSYALPALIAMGVARHCHRPTRNPVARLIRNCAEARAMKVLEKIQPGNGGFLEATPLTSFVVMSLAASGYAEHAVTRKGVEFLLASARENGSWPIDTNLATWLTTLSVNALDREALQFLPEMESARIREWLFRQQFRERHPYTNAPPGGWAWTDLPGGVPDADDTAGALLALRNLGAIDDKAREAAWAGIEWLLNLQNSDGGVPTFCRGWGKLPFDQSSADLTAHAMRAWAAWLPELPPGNQQRVRKAMARAIQYLKSHQEQTDELAGGWKPLWFGNQHRQDEINWTYGTSRVLPALAENADQGGLGREAEAAAHFLVRTQLTDGGWGAGNGSMESSVEETALAVEALAGWLEHCGRTVSKDRAHQVESAVAKGVCWLLDRVEEGAWQRPAPIGFYFAKLWYYERLYPEIFTVGALGRAARILKN